MNLTCPKCGQQMMLDFKTDQVRCQHCGYIRPDEISGLESKESAVKAHGVAPAVQLTYKGTINPNALAAFNSGQDALFNGDKSGALQSFRRAADYMPDWTDAHLWIVKVADDEQTKRDELSIVLAEMPNNLEALRLLMVLNGRLTPEQAAHTYHDNDPRLQKVTALDAKATDLICPTCGGDLTINNQTGRVECRSCGYSAPQAKQPTDASGDLLSMALLERKAQPIRWNVGQRLIQCQQCGAEQTIPAGQMSQRCRFCGANAVLVSDAIDSFTQPEELIPFRLNAAQAEESISHALQGVGERLMGLFGHHQIERQVVEGVYLPFWVFDAMIEVTQVKTVSGIDQDRATMIDMQQNIAACAVKSPGRELTSQLGNYDFSTAVHYEPKWLASYPAQLYRIDFDEASLDAHAQAAEAMKHKYAHRMEEVQDFQHNRNPEIIFVYPQVQSMTFRLVLLPVWIATLTIAGGQERLAVVNGQTGKAALGQPHRQSNSHS